MITEDQLTRAVLSLQEGNFFLSQVLTIPLVHSGVLQSFKAWDKARLERRQKRLAIWWYFKLLKSIAQMHSITSSIMGLLRRQWGWSPHAPLWLSRPGSSQKLHLPPSPPVWQPQWGIPIIEVALSNTEHPGFPPDPLQVKPGLRVWLYPCPLVPCPLILRGKLASWGLRWTVYDPSQQRNPFLHPTLREYTTLSVLGKTTLFQHVPPLTRAVRGMSKLPSSSAHPLASRELHAQGILQHPSVSEGLLLLKDGML